MHYFIDGYNLLFRLQHTDEDLQKQREAIIHDLNKKISLIKIDVSIVFDSAFQIGERTRSHYHEIEILFTAEGKLLTNTLSMKSKIILILSKKPLSLLIKN